MATDSAIPGNEHALKSLSEAIETGQAIAFVGAGASAGLYPLWNGLLALLVEEAGRRGTDEATRQHWLAPHTDPIDAVARIREALDRSFGAVLRKAFAPKAGPDGRKYTSLHEAVLRLPICGIVTTNYDPGLLEARKTIRPEAATGSPATWCDEDAVRRWQTDEVFSEESCPILFAHGIYDRSETIVLGRGEYRKAYTPGPYRELFKKLWAQGRLLIIGFSFNDDYLGFVADEAIGQAIGRASGEPRHIAFIGLREEERYTDSMRRTFRDRYDAEIVFYRVRTRPDGGRDHGELLELLKRFGNIQPASSDTSSASRPKGPVWNVPFPRNPYFTGRRDTLRRLGRALKAKTAAALTQQAVTGLGGIGKTQTAVEFCYAHRDDYRAVLWARADKAANLQADYRAIAGLLDLSEKDAKEADSVRDSVIRWLEREAGYLLVLDNADEPELVRPFLPRQPAGHVLITSRAHDLGSLRVPDPIDLELMSQDEAVSFLLKRTRRRKSADAGEKASAAALAEELGYLPLALEQAAAYIRHHEDRFDDYLADYRRLALEHLEEHGPAEGDYPATVRTTWTKSIAAVRAESPASVALLEMAAFFAPDRIPYELVAAAIAELPPDMSAELPGEATDPKILKHLLTPLTRYSLIRRDPATRSLSIHRLVQAVIRGEMDAATRGDRINRAFRTLDTVIKPGGGSNVFRQAPHVVAAVVQYSEAVGGKDDPSTMKIRQYEEIFLNLLSKLGYR